MTTPGIVEEVENRGRRFVHEDRYVLVLLLIVATIISTALVGEGTVLTLIPLALTSATLLVTLSTSDAGPRARRAGRVTVFVSFVVVALAAALHYDLLARMGFFAVTVALGTFTPVVIARRLWQHPYVSVNTVAGAADIYLLIGLLYSVVYALIGAVQAGHLDMVATAGAQSASAHAAFFISARPTVPSDFLYFSFATLTTVGYGDLTASSEFGRLLSNTEALLGQLYLVTVVAVLVSNMGRGRSQSESESGGDAAES